MALLVIVAMAVHLVIKHGIFDSIAVKAVALTVFCIVCSIFSFMSVTSFDKENYGPIFKFVLEFLAVWAAIVIAIMMACTKSYYT
jgi:hypothetical protein